MTATTTPTAEAHDHLAPASAAYWDIRDLQFHCRIGRSTAWRMVREEGFPAPIVYSRRLLIWPRAEVIEFLERRRDASHYNRPPKRRKPAPELSPTFSGRPVRRRRPNSDNCA